MNALVLSSSIKSFVDCCYLTHLTTSLKERSVFKCRKPLTIETQLQPYNSKNHTINNVRGRAD